MIRRKDIKSTAEEYIERYDSDIEVLEAFIKKYRRRSDWIMDINVNPSVNNIHIINFMLVFYSELKNYSGLLETCLELANSNDRDNELLAIGILKSYRDKIRSKLAYKKRKRMIKRLK